MKPMQLIHTIARLTQHGELVEVEPGKKEEFDGTGSALDALDRLISEARAIVESGVVEIETTHQGTPVILRTVPDGDEEEYAFLDLGTKRGAPDNDGGPRIAFRRFQSAIGGWRFVLHADGGDPFKSIEITDGNKIGCPDIHEEVDETETEEIEECQKCQCEVTREDPYFSSPCGTFCEEHMEEHATECECCAKEFDLWQDDEALQPNEKGDLDR